MLTTLASVHSHTHVHSALASRVVEVHTEDGILADYNKSG